MDIAKYNSGVKNSFGNKYSSKFSNLPKKNLLITLIIALALPLTVVVAQQKQIFQPRAQEIDPSVTVNKEPFNEDNAPSDPVVQNSPLVNSQAAEVDSKASAVATTTKPNIVVIMLDDINPLDGKMWSNSITPNIYNIFISQGINFTNYYGETSLCCPGRVGFLTGQHTQNHGVGDLDGTKFKPGETIAAKLQSQGYYTMLTGKYINYFNAIPLNKAIPPGWTKFDAIYNANGKYYDYTMLSKNGSSYTTKKYGTTAVDYSTDVDTNIAVQRLKEAPIDKPIFAFISPYSAHGPWTPAPRHIGDPKCKNLTWQTPNYNEADVSDKPAYIQNLPLLTSYNLTKYCETILSADDMVGRITKELTREGRINNTLFIFTADNGMSWGEHRLEAKTTPYATHLPLYITWPDARGKTPTANSTTVSNIDLAPTFCKIAGCVMGPYPNGQQISDGISILPLFKNQTLTTQRDAILESQPPLLPGQAAPNDRPAWWAIRTSAINSLGLWHYVEYENGEKELYNLSNGPCYLWTSDKNGDPCELNNLLAANSTPSDQTLSIAQTLKTRLDQLKSEKGYGNFSAPAPSPIVTIKSFTAIADSYVKKDSPKNNYDSALYMRIDGDPGSIAYIKFNLSSLKGKTIDKAILSVRVSTNDSASADLDVNPANVRQTTNVWTETGINYNNRPASGATVSTIKGKRTQNTLIETDVTPGINFSAGKEVSFAIQSSGGTDGLLINTRKAVSGKPKLTITYH